LKIIVTQLQSFAVLINGVVLCEVPCSLVPSLCDHHRMHLANGIVFELKINNTELHQKLVNWLNLGLEKIFFFFFCLNSNHCFLFFFFKGESGLSMWIKILKGNSFCWSIQLLEVCLEQLQCVYVSFFHYQPYET
jgi:hypothetical protein